MLCLLGLNTCAIGGSNKIFNSTVYTYIQGFMQIHAKGRYLSHFKCNKIYIFEVRIQRLLQEYLFALMVSETKF